MANVTEQQWEIVRDGDHVVAAFFGKLETDEGRRSALAFVELLGSDPTPVIFDLREMEGYESGARKAWQEALGPVRQRILEIEVVGGNALVRMGATTLGMLLGITVRGVSAAEATDTTAPRR